MSYDDMFDIVLDMQQDVADIANVLHVQDPKAMSNKAIEICVTLLSLYLVVELNNIPQGRNFLPATCMPCSPIHSRRLYLGCDSLGPCLAQYIA
jgi:hypothetical protein